MATDSELEDRANPELNRVLQPGEMVIASGHAVTNEQKRKGEFFAFKAVSRARHYWVVITGERLILIGMGLGAVPKGAEYERAEPLPNVHVLDVKRSFTQHVVHLRLGEDELQLRTKKQLAGALQSRG